MEQPHTIQGVHQWCQQGDIKDVIQMPVIWHIKGPVGNLEHGPQWNLFKPDSPRETTRMGSPQGQRFLSFPHS